MSSNQPHELYPFQQEAVNKLANVPACIISDDMRPNRSR